VTFYNQAAADLAAIRAWWFALAPAEQRQPNDESTGSSNGRSGSWVPSSPAGSRRCRTQ
jgi:hypothetical protein